MLLVALSYIPIGILLLGDSIIARRRLAREVAVLSSVQRDVQRLMLPVTGNGPWRSTQPRHAGAPV